MQADILTNRLGVFAVLAEGARGRLGRTSLMKLCYFLQVIRGVPLEYNFALYSYGPFDSEVLADLQSAEVLRVINSDINHYAGGGYGYDLTSGDEADKAKLYASPFIKKYTHDISWVLGVFGSSNASDLELLSTIMYVYFERQISRESLVTKVKAIKPHFSESQISNKVQFLQDRSLISWK